jgi:hypothetical protein
MPRTKKSDRPARVSKLEAHEHPMLHCPDCVIQTLTYMRSIIGGVTRPERWDILVCRRCGFEWEFRHRTAALRRSP